MEAVLKYPGAKNRLAEWIISFIPEHRVYLELFFGSGAVFFNKDPAKIETLNDLDGEVYNLFKVIRDRPEEFAKSLEMTPYSREEYENAYKKVSAETELERARKFMVRCWLGMGSSNVYKNGFRSSQQGNSPKTTKHWGELPDRVLLAAERLKHAQIEKLPALELLKRYDTPDVFIYLDPPYLPGTRASQKFVKAHPSATIYEKYSRQYTAIIHTLIEYLPPKEKKNISRLAALRNG